MTKPDFSYSLKKPPTADLSISTDRTSILHRKPKTFGPPNSFHLISQLPHQTCAAVFRSHPEGNHSSASIAITLAQPPSTVTCTITVISSQATLSLYLHSHSTFHSAARHSLLKSGSKPLALLLQIFPSSYFLQIRDLEPQVVILDLITGCPYPHTY